MERTILEKIPPGTDERDGMPGVGEERITEDEEILDRFFARDEGAIGICRDKYGGRCRAVAENILGSPEDAEECVSDALLRAWGAIPPERPRFLGAWLAAVTRRLAAGDGDPWNTEEDTLERLRDALNRFLAGERPEARRIFLRRYWYACSVAECARREGKSEAAVKMSLSRTKKRLRAFLEKEGFSV